MALGEQPRFLFVYGLLRSDVGGPMQPVLGRSARLAGHAKWRGALYLVEEYPAAFPSDSDDWVSGELYELPEDPQTLLAALDAYEDVPNDYMRISSSVYAGGDPVQAWIYVWNRSLAGLRRIPSGDFDDCDRQSERSGRLPASPNDEEAEF